MTDARETPDGTGTEAPTPNDRVAVGLINGPWGLRGHVKVLPYSSNPERFEPGSVLLVRGRPTRILDVRRPRGFPCVRFEGFNSANAAEALRGELIEIHESELPELSPGEHYVHDLIGLAVVTTSGDDLGRLQEVITTGANDVYLVRQEGRRDILIPAIADVIIEVDLDGRRMVVDPLDGLLD